MRAFWKRSLSAYTTVSLVSELMSLQSEYRCGLARAVPTSTPCSDERAGTVFHCGATGAACTACASCLVGSGTSNALAMRGTSNSMRADSGSVGAAAPAATSAGLGASAAPAKVLMVRAQSHAAITEATSESGHVYLCRTTSMILE